MKTSKNTIVKLVKETLELKAGSVVALDLKAGQSLNVASGRLWLTRSGDSHDYWLRPGNQLVFGAATSVLAEADRDSRFELRSTGAELDLSWLRIAAQKLLQWAQLGMSHGLPKSTSQPGDGLSIKC
ncbi:DUF2917 domain-containing protein [Undibacterium arcticum]|uniref:DUF2917 domain-containing protein n=1 Tax=Undibacterium arcticum TaxID=1762892 RepID=A0ABV7EY49_9BURK